MNAKGLWESTNIPERFCCAQLVNLWQGGTGQKNFIPGDDGTEVAALAAVVQRRGVHAFRDGTENAAHADRDITRMRLTVNLWYY